MQIKELLKKVNIKGVIVASIIATIMLLEIVYSGNIFFQTIIPMQTYEQWDEILVNNLSIEGNDFHSTGANSYIVVPMNSSYTSIRINMKPEDAEKIIVRAYYPYEEGFSANYSKKLIVSQDDTTIEFKSDKHVGAVKLQFIGAEDGYADFTLNRIEFGNGKLLFSKRFLVKSFVAWIALVGVMYTLLWIASNLFGRNKNSIFWKTLFVTGICSVIIMGVTKSYYLAGYFHKNLDDVFMDYFNMLSLTFADDVYILKANWPAMCFVILSAMKAFISNPGMPINNAVMLGENAINLRDNEIAMMGFVLIFVACFILIAYSVKSILNSESDRKNILLLLLSGPILCTVERGNLIMVSFAFLMVYLALYNAEDKRLRYIAFFALSLSASIKLYPALFGLLTLRRKKWKETVALAVMGFFTFVIPYFYFDGVVTIIKWLGGMSAANDVLTSNGVGGNYSIRNFTTILGTMLGVKGELYGWIPAVMLVVLLVAALFCKREWERLFLIATACIWFPYFSFTYTLMLYIPAAVVYMNQSDEEKAEIDAFLLGLLQAILILPMWSWVDSFSKRKNLDCPMNVTTFVLNTVIVIIVFKILVGSIFEGRIRRTLEVQIVCIAAAVIVVIFGTINRSYGLEDSFAGKGSSCNPYQIASVEDWRKLQQIVNSGNSVSGVHFIQTADIEFDGVTSVNPVGWGRNNVKFDGVYDGQGYSIKNYYSLSDNDENMGLFGRLSGQIYNVNLENCNIAGSIVGGIAYDVSGTGIISNCYVNGLLYGYRVGGIAAMNSGTIENCVAFVNMEGANKYGVAADYGGKTENCFTNEVIKTGSGSLIDENTLSRVNNYIELNNKTINARQKFLPWLIDGGMFKIVKNM
ncbi:glycosyltransferase family 87 protein [Pseudobutyrivibrio xylanivorans]|uniref:Glycosyl transferase family 87 n=1 Tax=Pseudobutyrivibrio xylanivorans TaxID=185007 RepID=A0A5P6VN02_PSEXY|nr:glycosyltransferase family 87 protein [Pseudobutyrivibrio xylanivorans]QFJ53947.1 glycosyl transferase family 87 [Pseudobutyrivibrio xylanivorans]